MSQDRRRQTHLRLAQPCQTRSIEASPGMIWKSNVVYLKSGCAVPSRKSRQLKISCPTAASQTPQPLRRPRSQRAHCQRRRRWQADLANLCRLAHPRTLLGDAARPDQCAIVNLGWRDRRALGPGPTVTVALPEVHRPRMSASLLAGSMY